MSKAIATIGPYDLFPVETGTFRLDGGAMFGVVPKPLWEKRIPADDRNRIPLAARALLLSSADKRILIDVGLGNQWNDKDRDIYAVEHASNDLLRSLRTLGIAAGEVTDVILTHLHFDHAGGSVAADPATGKKRPTFPQAVYHLQEDNFRHALNPTLRDRASYRKEDFEALQESDQLRLYRSPRGFDHDEEILPGLQPMVCYGHTPGLQMVKISDAKRTVLYTADTFPTAAHLPAPWIMGYDLQPLVTLEEKLQILRRCREGQWELYFEHDPQNGLTALSFDDKGAASIRR